MNLFTRSRRWKTSDDLDVDAFALTDQRWLLFAYVKNERLVDDGAFWKELLGSFDLGEAIGVARALKTEKQSEPLASIEAGGGGALPEEVWCREGWVRYRLETQKVLNPGLFLDQELNRHRLTELVQEFIACEKGSFGESDGVLNLFSYTGAFSMAALCAGARMTTSVDVSARYLGWEKENFEANFGGHDQLEHRLIRDDARDFIRRSAKKQATCRWIIIDPPTFSRGQGKAFCVQDELLALVADAADCLAPGGAILASTNDARWESRDFFSEMEKLAQAKALRLERGRTPVEFIVRHSFKSVWFFSAE